jgi:hypothetical protein
MTTKVENRWLGSMLYRRFVTFICVETFILRIIIYMKKFLNSDWLRAVQFFYFSNFLIFLIS